MDQNNKTELVKLLNNSKYEEAVSLFSKEDEWDYQAIEMFVTGFDITKCDLPNSGKKDASFYSSSYELPH